MEGVGTFPQRIPIGANRVGWSLNEVLEWIAAKKADRRAINNPPEINSRSNAGAVK